jgi:D-sedoheptulose 7-phosphate isomerase
VAIKFDVKKNFVCAINESLHNFELLQNDNSLHKSLETAVKFCVDAYATANKILAAGNGGSAADAQHLAGELISRFNFDRPALSAIALTTDSSAITAISNDYSYEEVFARQIKANGRVGDVFIAISTSGNSPNILKAIEAAKSIGLVVIGLTGQSGGKMKDMCDICLCAPSDSTPRIQECHLFFEHTLCACIEESLFGDLRK